MTIDKINLKIQFCSNPIWSTFFFEIEPITLSCYTAAHSFPFISFLQINANQTTFHFVLNTFFFSSLCDFLYTFVLRLWIRREREKKKNVHRFQMIAFRFIHESAYCSFLVFIPLENAQFFFVHHQFNRNRFYILRRRHF